MLSSCRRWILSATLVVVTSWAGLAHAQPGQDGHYAVKDWGQLLPLADLGDPEAILLRYALGKGEWSQVQDLADAGYGEARIKSLSRQIWQELPSGVTAALENRLKQEAARLEGAEIRTILAVHQVTGTWHPTLLTSSDPNALAKALSPSDPASLALGCRLSATYSAWAKELRDYCRLGAAAGLAESQYRLAVLHHGRPDDFAPGAANHISKDLKIVHSRRKALSFYKLAAAQGHAGAQARLALFNASGVEMPARPDQARRMAEQASETGHREGRTIFGLLLLKGMGGDADPQRAVWLLTQAARSGDRIAQTTLSALSMRGQHMPRDFSAALMWFHLAELTRRDDPPADEIEALLVEPLRRTRALARSVEDAALDLDARLAALRLRKELAESGQWPLVDPLP